MVRRRGRRIDGNAHPQRIVVTPTAHTAARNLFTKSRPPVAEPNLVKVEKRFF